NARPGMKDADRALTEEGREKLRRVLKRAKGVGVQPGVILSSPYLRALETAQVAAQVLGYRGKVVETQALAPDASPPQVWGEIRSGRDEAALLLASHEPLMSATLTFLLGSPGLLVDMKKGALARVDCDRFGPEPKCLLKWLLTAGTAGE